MKHALFLLLLLGNLLVITESNAKTYTYKENNMLMFNIKAFNELKRQNIGNSNFEIQASDGAILRYSENNDEYKELIITNNIYRVKHLFYKPSGMIKYEEMTFHNISVNTTKYYDEQGQVIQEIVHTPADWVDRITQVAKQNFNVDLWVPFNAMLFESRYQGKEFIKLIHLNGEPLSLRTGDPIRYFALLDFVTLKVVVAGEILNQSDSFFDPEKPDTKSAIYMVNGKPIVLDE